MRFWKISKFNSSSFLNFSIGAVIILIGLSTAYYFVIFLPSNEREKLDIEKQDKARQELIQQKEKEEVATKELEEKTYVREQEQKEYVAARKKECYDVYLSEKDEWSNVADHEYSEVRDVCIVKYDSDEPQRSDEECNKILDLATNTNAGALRDLRWDAYGNCIDNTFSKEF